MIAVRSTALVCVGALAVACGAAPRPRPLGPPVIATWPALDGGEVAVAALRGQIVVINVFATWSPATALELPVLAAADAAPDVTVIGLALDPEGYPLVAPWRTASDVTYLIALADEPTRAGAGALGAIAAVPTTIVLDRAGREIARLTGQLDDTSLDRAVDRARAAAAP